jgi:hypothetical protein
MLANRAAAGAARAQDIQQSVHHGAETVMSGMSRVSHGKQGFKPGPFGIGQVGGIAVCFHLCSLSHPAASLLLPVPKRSLIPVSSGMLYDTVLQNLPKDGHARPGVWFLLHGRQFHARLSLRARADGSTGVLTVRGTPGQLREIDGGIQISIEDQTALLAVNGPVGEGQICIDPATVTAPLAGGLPAIGQDHSRSIPACFIE